MISIYDMSVFYTRKGDDGRSRIGKKKIYKFDPFVVVLGELDELNSFIGIVKSHRRVLPSLKKQLHQVQENLFIIQANIAAVMLWQNGKHKPPEFKKENTENMENMIDGIEKKLKPARKFVISGTTHISAWLDYLRALSRSVERSVFVVAKIKRETPINPDIFPYLNRLSSLFFALARWETRHKKEKHPKY